MGSHIQGTTPTIRDTHTGSPPRKFPPCIPPLFLANNMSSSLVALEELPPLPVHSPPVDVPSRSSIKLQKQREGTAPLFDCIEDGWCDACNHRGCVFRCVTCVDCCVYTFCALCLCADRVRVVSTAYGHRTVVPAHFWHLRVPEGGAGVIEAVYSARVLGERRIERQRFHSGLCHCQIMAATYE